MKFREFIKEKLITIFLILFAIVTIEILLTTYSINILLKIYIPVIVFSMYFVGISIEYFKRKNFYNQLSTTLNELEEKYLVNEIIGTPDFIEGKILKDSLEQINKSMLENVNKYRYMTEDYKEYVELWIHEIKIPIATSKLIIENNKSAITKSINDELDKVENYIEQALYYARSNTVEKDYYIRKNNLKDIVNESIKKNKSILIGKKITLDIHDLDIEVSTDSKWVVFIINQIIQNSVKYKKEDLKLEIYAKSKKENVILYICDNGIGIPKGEITRAFEKGFTGSNGRLKNKKSTGIGLYLCKKLCDKLGIAIELNSIQDEGTEVRLVFPRGSFSGLE